MRNHGDPSHLTWRARLYTMATVGQPPMTIFSEFLAGQLTRVLWASEDGIAREKPVIKTFSRINRLDLQVDSQCLRGGRTARFSEDWTRGRVNSVGEGLKQRHMKHRTLNPAKLHCSWPPTPRQVKALQIAAPFGFALAVGLLFEVLSCNPFLEFETVARLV